MQPKKVIDGVVGVSSRQQLPPPPRPPLAPPRSSGRAIPPPPPRRRNFTAPQQYLPRRRWWHKLLFPACVLLCLCASFLVQSLPLGIAALSVYAIVAWLRRLPSRYSFGLAFLSLITVIVVLLVRQNVELASNFATYTFLLLVIGVMSAIIESRSYLKRKSSKMHRLHLRFRLW